MKGRWLDTDFKDVHFNLALEHAILYLHAQSEFSGTIRSWNNPNAVILGRNQHIEEEVNVTYCSDNKIIIGRRISGGGTVFHDLGVLNISIFLPKSLLVPKFQDVNSISRLFTKLMVDCLSRELKGDSFTIYKDTSILYKKKKISGSAGYFRSSWFLHHLTLLLNADLTHIENALLAGKLTYQSRRPSLSFPTTNLPPLSRKSLIDTFVNQIEEKFNLDFKTEKPTLSEKRLGTYLTREMYSKNSWIQEKKRKLIEKEFSSP